MYLAHPAILHDPWAEVWPWYVCCCCRCCWCYFETHTIHTILWAWTPDNRYASEMREMTIHSAVGPLPLGHIWIGSERAQWGVKVKRSKVNEGSHQSASPCPFDDNESRWHTVAKRQKNRTLDPLSPMLPFLATFLTRSADFLSSSTPSCALHLISFINRDTFPMPKDHAHCQGQVVKRPRNGSWTQVTQTTP